MHAFGKKIAVDEKLNNLWDYTLHINYKTAIFTQENKSTNIVYKMSAMLFQTQCVDSSPHSAAYMSQWIGSLLLLIMACRLFDAKPII